jgi:hypothetical protein
MPMRGITSAREQAAETIASLERQVAALKKLGGHEWEIESCERAIEHLKEILGPIALSPPGG